MNLIGVMQGRLLPKYKGRYQAHPKNNWQDEFFIAKELDLDLIEFIFDYDDFSQNPLFSESGVNSVKKIIKESKVYVKTVCADFFMDFPLHSNDVYKQKDAIQVLKTLVDKVSILGVTDIIIPCVDKSSLKKPIDLKNFKNSILEILNDLEKKKINLSLETDFNPKKFRNFLDQFQSEYIKVNYDIGNSASLGYDFKEEMKLYGNKISDIHIKDRELNGGPVLLGNGNADFEGVFKCLKHIKYKGPFIMQAYRDDDGLEIFKRQFRWIKKKLSLSYDY